MKAVGLLEAAQEVLASGKPYFEGSVPATGEKVAGRVVDVSIFPLSGEAVAMTFIDVTDQQAAQAKLRQLVDYDPMTQLWNRNKFRLELHTTLNQGRPLRLALLDLDRFKQVNDTMGHSSGDHLLETIGNRLRSRSPASWKLARLGGDEFAVLAPIPPGETDTDFESQSFANQIANIVQEPVELNGLLLKPTTSIGVATAPRDGTDMRTLMSLADDALYSAKRSRSQFVVCNTNQRFDNRSQTRLYEAIDQGFAEKQFLLYGQPIVDLKSGHIAGIECLSRWALPGSGVLLPAEYLHLFILGGRSTQITDLMLTKALELTEGGRFCSVNLSSVDLFREDLVGSIQSLAQGRDISNLWLEILESEINEYGADAIDSLIAADITVAIDDFSAAFSSLQRVAQHETAVLKLDRSLIKSVSESQRGLRLVRSLVDGAHELGNCVVAEGVESSDELRAAEELGCDFAQGFLLGWPAPKELVQPLLISKEVLTCESWPGLDEIEDWEATLALRSAPADLISAGGQH